MILCGPCVADVMNARQEYEISGHSGYILPVQLFAEVIEQYATEDPERPSITTRDSGLQSQRALTLRAVSTLDGLPLCVWHVAERPWIGRRR